jgi:carbamoyl-phosphate synthase small subunit
MFYPLVALACGVDTERLKFGHRGSKHPVKNLETNTVEITSQNHGYTVRMESLEGTDLSVTHVALNDGTAEG